MRSSEFSLLRQSCRQIPFTLGNLFIGAKCQADILSLNSVLFQFSNRFGIRAYLLKDAWGRAFRADWIASRDLMS